MKLIKILGFDKIPTVIICDRYPSYLFVHWNDSFYFGIQLYGCDDYATNKIKLDFNTHPIDERNLVLGKLVDLEKMSMCTFDFSGVNPMLILNKWIS